jgi:hypothetical protein
MSVENKNHMAMPITEIPPDWDRDALSEFIETARHNTFATFVNLLREYSVLKNIHELYKYAIDNLINTPEWFAAFFLLRAHSAYLGGVRLAISGQCAETYMVLRGCIEAAIYGLYLSRNKNSQETWLSRHNNEESLKRVKKEFKIVNLFNFLKTVDPKNYNTATLLYERTIDYGAHPNELALTSLLKKTDEGDMIKFNLNYLSGYTPAFHLSLKTTAQVGLCSLYIFKNVYSDRFKILGLSEKLDKLTAGL